MGRRLSILQSLYPIMVNFLATKVGLRSTHIGVRLVEDVAVPDVTHVELTLPYLLLRILPIRQL